MRRSAIILAATAVVAPFGWAYLSITAAHIPEGMLGAYICGLQALATIVLACFASSVVSAASVVLGAVAYRRLPEPRPLRRRLELASLSLPLVVFGGYAAMILFA